jgi:hypothetical protein
VAIEYNSAQKATRERRKAVNVLLRGTEETKRYIKEATQVGIYVCACVIQRLFIFLCMNVHKNFLSPGFKSRTPVSANNIIFSCVISVFI